LNCISKIDLERYSKDIGQSQNKNNFNIDR